MGRFSNAWNILTNNIGNFIKILLFSYFASLLLSVLCIIPLGVGVILSLIISVLLTYIEVFLTNFLLKKQEITMKSISDAFNESCNMFSSIFLYYLVFFIKTFCLMITVIIIICLNMGITLGISSFSNIYFGFGSLCFFIFILLPITVYFCLRFEAKYYASLVGLLFNDRYNAYLDAINYKSKVWWLLIPIIGKNLYMIELISGASNHYLKREDF